YLKFRTFSIVTRLPSKVARAVRATSGVQSRVLLAGIAVHQSPTTITGNSATTRPLNSGRTATARTMQTIASPEAIGAAMTRGCGPSNQIAIAAHATAATAITDSISVATKRTARPSISGF